MTLKLWFIENAKIGIENKKNIVIKNIESHDE